MPHPSIPPRAVLHRLLAAVAGVMAIHQLAYLVAHPGTVGRAVAADGHGYLQPVADVVVPAAVALALWALLCRLITTRPRALRSSVPGVGDYVALFVLQELGERLADGQAATAVLGEPAVWVGLALAPALVFVSRGLARTLDRLDVVPVFGVILPPPAPVGPVVPVGPSLPVFALTPAVRRVRGPPVSLR